MAQVTAPSSWPLARRINKAALSRLSRLRHRRVVTLPTDRAILALSFDDVPMSAAIEGARILDRFGVRATYYVCGGIDPAEPGAPFADAATLQSLSRDGFEIGCHSFRHIDFQDHDLRALTTDLDRNARWFAENGLPEPRSFAYPYGRTRPLAKALCAGRFALCRGVKPAWVRGAFDAALAPSLPLFADAGSVALLDQAMRSIAEGGGAVFAFTHAVTDTPGLYDCTADQLAATMTRAHELGIEVMRMDDVVGAAD